MQEPRRGILPGPDGPSWAAAVRRLLPRRPPRRPDEVVLLVLVVPAVCARHHGLLLERHDVAHDVGELLVADVPRVETLPRL